MNAEDLLRAMSEIDDDLVLRSDKKRTGSWKPFLTMAACFLFLLGMGATLFSLNHIRQPIQAALFYSPDSDAHASYNQAAHEALSAYYGNRDVQYSYYETASTEDRSAQITNAITEGCNLILLDGRQEGNTILSLASTHPKVTFLLLGISEESLGTAPLPDNVLCVPYRPEIAGYLAGYTAIKEGYTKLGYYYDSGVSSYFAYGSGYLQGIEAAAKELHITNRIQVRVSSTYDDALDLLADIERLDSWYSNGTEMVLACGPQSCSAVKIVAKNHKGDVILVGDQQIASDPTDTISQSIAQILDKIQNNTLGQEKFEPMPYYTLNNTDGSWGFANVSEAEFSSLRNDLINGTIPCKAEMVKAEEYSIKVLFS